MSGANVDVRVRSSVCNGCVTWIRVSDIMYGCVAGYHRKLLLWEWWSVLLTMPGMCVKDIGAFQCVFKL